LDEPRLPVYDETHGPVGDYVEVKVEREEWGDLDSTDVVVDVSPVAGNSSRDRPVKGSISI
jgi:hypothetical protein